MNNRLDSDQEKKKPLLVLAVTSHVSMDFFKGQIDFLQKDGFDLAIICSPGWDNCEGIKYYPIAMEREIAIVKDLKALYLLIKLFHEIKPTIVNVGTPKAGLLVGMAAFINKVPIRIYTCHGLRLETLTGWKRQLLALTEKIAAFCAHTVVCVSNSLRRKFNKLNLAVEEKVTVIGAGSCNGIDLDKFNKDQEGCINKKNILKGKNIAQDAVFIGFIGRLTKDKGIYELVEAFEILKQKFPNLCLLLLGGFEDGDPISESMRRNISEDSRIINVGVIADTVPYYQLMKILVLPTYREGLPTVLLEAGAMEIPVVASRATGCVDVVVDGETGLLIPIGDSTALANAVELLLTNETLNLTMGTAARQRMEQHYNQEMVWGNVVGFYKSLLATKKKDRLGSVTAGFMKRMVDLLLASILIVVLSPVLLLVFVIIRSQMGSPVFFKQQRPGFHSKPFYMYKFRTMTEAKDAQGGLLPDEQRLTKLGAIIRRISLDELPQLINVLKGELSLVGPRPLLMKYLPLYTPEQARRHDVKPGITGWAQVNGRNAISWEDKFKLDIWYVDNQSFWLDVKILCMTVGKVLKRDGISQQGYVNMSEFKGNRTLKL